MLHQVVPLKNLPRRLQSSSPEIQGQTTLMLKPGDGFQIPAGTPHAGGAPATQKTKLVSTYVVEKGKPLASPA